MARATFVKSARKDYPDQKIKKGESYYWWKFRFGGKIRSKKAPRPSQLTQSAFRSTLCSLEEQIEDGLFRVDNTDDLQSNVESFKEEIQQLADETQESLDNMPDQLQEGDTGQMLQERIEGLESWISELDGIDLNVDEEEFKEELIEELREEHKDENELTDEEAEKYDPPEDDKFNEKMTEKVSEKIEEIADELSDTYPDIE
ncbi:MAG: hypothetical protein KAU20_02285 [Nanoarchaeota archaeon]|nr:hypothetical protein [Nanoarchaeota archaeon]